MWHDGWGWGVGGFVMMILMMGLFWAAIVATIVWGIRQFRPRDASSPGGSTSAMRILEERFARGEIDADEFQRRREILRGGTG
jgi:putative membrane protein